MSSSPRRIGVTLLVLGVASALVAIMFFAGPKPAPSQRNTPSPTPQAAEPDDGSTEPPARPGVDAPDRQTEPSEADKTDAPMPAAAPPADWLAGLEPRPVTNDAAPELLGSLDPREAMLHFEMTASGAGIKKITLPLYWNTASDSRAAEAHYAAVEAGDPSPPPLPPIEERYVLQESQPWQFFDRTTGKWVQTAIPILAATAIEIDGREVALRWAVTGPGRFEAIIQDADGNDVLKCTRVYVLSTGFDFTLEQRVENRSDHALTIRWMQYGPGDLVPDRSRYIDRRRFRFGWRPDPVGLPTLIVATADQLTEQASAVKRARKSSEARDAGNMQRSVELGHLWPNKDSQGLDLVWFATTNRYFALCIHPAPRADGTPPLSFADVVEKVSLETSPLGPKEHVVATGIRSPARVLASGAETAFDMGAYAGPLARKYLDAEGSPQAALGLKELILFQMSPWCGACTFQWLAWVLMWFLSIADIAVGDWGVAIILLVLVVRTVLHPLTKKGQIHMQRTSKAMGELKPELDKLQKKYKDDPRKLQQEQMKMWRERGINPLGCVFGMLPMFLQMPIWIALYAMLYFAFELRQEPAFWGVFQLFGGWPFLADLSAADHCLWEFEKPFRFLLWNVTGINVLPLLMGLVFYFQQKYMSPPPSPSMTKEQLQQQKIMKVMMVVMFPVMLYSAPSGLTLYIFTSSLFGIIESRYIRQHIKDIELNPPKKKAKRKKPRGAQARAFAEAIERAKRKSQPPGKTYKKRK